MPKKSEFLPPPKPDSHPEEAAILTRIFKKEPLITYRELLDKYKSEVSKQQGLLGLLAYLPRIWTGRTMTRSSRSLFRQSRLRCKWRFCPVPSMAI